MPSIFNLFIVPLIVSCLVAYLSTPLIIKMAWKYGLIDDPKKNKHPKVIHTKPTPRAGGGAIFISVVAGIFLFLPVDKHILGIIIGAVLVVIMGLADDKVKLSPYLRLFLQFVAASLPIVAGIGIAFVTNPLTGGVIDLSHPQIVFNFLGTTHTIWILSDIFALLWIVILMNFLNMGAKGVDGQLPGVVAIAALAIAFLSLRFSADITEWPVTILAGITAGAFLGFLPWNMYPQKIMPAFSGSNLAGYLLGVLTILTTTKVGILAIVIAVPLIDTTYTVVRRITQGKSPVWGDRGHLHHKLLDAGLKKPQVAAIYWIASAILGIIALSLNTQLKLYTIIILIILIGILIVWLTYRQKQSQA